MHLKQQGRWSRGRVGLDSTRPTEAQASSVSAISPRAYKSRGLGVVLLCSLLLALHASPGARGQRAASVDAAPAFNVNYRDNGTITVTLSDGTSVGAARAPGTVIPPG